MVHHIKRTMDVKRKEGWNESSPRKKESSKGILSSKLAEFCKRTDLHGYKYLVMKDLSILERSCWAIAVIASTVIAVFFVCTVYNWYARNPIVTVIESTQGAIWDIPFPAITFCDLNVISRTEAWAFAHNLTLPSNITADEVFKIIRLAPLLHSTFFVGEEPITQLEKLQSILDMNSISMESFFLQLSPASSCNKLVERCMWKNTIYRCDLLFQQVFTFFRVCCSFNYLAFVKDNVNIGDSNSRLPKSDSPRRVASCGYQTALTVLLNIDVNNYYSVLSASHGAVVMIDNAHNVADMDSPVRLVNPETELLIALSPEYTYTTAGVRSFSPQDRQCYYSDEVKMGNLRHYSFHNCIALQRVEVIKNTCDCVPFYFPLKDYHRTCNFNDMDCLNSLLDNAREDGYKDQRFQCLPECEHYDYPIEVAFGKMATEFDLDGLPFYNDIKLENRSLVNVFFNDLVSTRYRRDVYLNWQNLLASFGGLLSLMLGFTLIAGFDLILYFTFGIACGSLAADSHEDEVKSDSKLRNFKSKKVNVQEVQIKNIDNKTLKSKLSPKEDLYKWKIDTIYDNRKY